MKETLITLFDALVLGFFAVKTVDALRWLAVWFRSKVFLVYNGKPVANAEKTIEQIKASICDCGGIGEFHLIECPKRQGGKNGSN